MSTNVSISQIAKEKETFQDVLPGIIASLVTNPKFAQVPEVGSWVKQVLTIALLLIRLYLRNSLVTHGQPITGSMGNFHYPWFHGIIKLIYFVQLFYLHK